MSLTAHSPARTRRFTAAKLLPVVFAGLAFNSTVLASAAQARSLSAASFDMPAAAQLVDLPMLNVRPAFAASARWARPSLRARPWTSGPAPRPRSTPRAGSSIG